MKPVDERMVRDLDDLVKWGPNVGQLANSSPARFVWVRSTEGKAKLSALAIDQNRPKILAAPVTVIDHCVFFVNGAGAPSGGFKSCDDRLVFRA
jgi:hypothetical protein